MLFKELAIETVRKHLYTQRLKSLDAQSAVEKAGFQVFLAGYQAKEVALLESSRQSALGLEAVSALQLGLNELLDAMRKEISGLTPLRQRAHELMLDVAADLATAYRLGHNADWMLLYYEQQHIKAIKSEIENETRQYTMLQRQQFIDQALKKTAKIQNLKVKEDRSSRAIEGFKKNMEQLDEGVTDSWSFLCQHALGGSVEAKATRILVRTSEANRKAWGGDRQLERPERWNQDMTAEAEAAEQLLMDE